MKVLANILDALHVPLFVELLWLNFFPRTQRLAMYACVLVMSLQIACGGCPLTLLTCHMRGDMSRFENSLTRSMYSRFGLVMWVIFWAIITSSGYLWCRWRLAQL